MKRSLLLLPALGLSGVASAQIPDVKLRLDAIASYRNQKLGNTRLRYYSVFGQLSTVALTFQLEPGFTAYLSQKIERIPNDPDGNSVDEAYIEDEGIWRVGKQYLPFGSGEVFRESVPAARADTQLIVEELPIRFAFVDAGDGRQQGLVARFGSTVAASIAIGEHFGINGTSLTQVRRPEDSPGLGAGWRRAFGFDANLTWGAAAVRAEAVLLRGGYGAGDDDLTIFDVAARFRQRAFAVFEFGYTREASQGSDILRALAEVDMTENLAARPFIRVRNGRVWDVGIELRVRL
jgi:hypothetical protein